MGFIIGLIMSLMAQQGVHISPSEIRQAYTSGENEIVWDENESSGRIIWDENENVTIIWDENEGN